MGERILIIGMNNPSSDEPHHALWPDPPRCTGHRLWEITAARTGCSRREYIQAFHRTNLVIGPWNATSARNNWEWAAAEVREHYDLVLMLGSAVRRAMGVTGSDVPVAGIRGDLAALPHPSGLNRWYNDRVNRAAAELLMEELYIRALSD